MLTSSGCFTFLHTCICSWSRSYFWQIIITWESLLLLIKMKSSHVWNKLTLNLSLVPFYTFRRGVKPLLSFSYCFSLYFILNTYILNEYFDIRWVQKAVLISEAVDPKSTLPLLWKSGCAQLPTTPTWCNGCFLFIHQCFVIVKVWFSSIFWQVGDNIWICIYSMVQICLRIASLFETKALN